MSADNTESPDFGPVNGCSVLGLLFTRARDHLTEPELQHLAGAWIHAQEIARLSSVVANGVGCLVGGDASQGAGRIRSGNFSDDGHEVADLLWHFASVFSHIDGLLSVGSDAACLLADLRKQQGQ